MPARIVMAHDDEAFVIAAAAALRSAGYSIVTFADSMLALEALLGAQSVELLITRIAFARGKPNGVALARMGRAKRSGMKVVFTALVEYAKIAEGLGAFLPLPVEVSDLVATVARLLGDAGAVPEQGLQTILSYHQSSL
jgi:DNA-binding NtrC family response regulator